jgi:soluble lytic murein transglycosylase-like protein
MRQKIKTILVAIAIIMVIPTMAYSQTEKEVKKWERVMNAIIQVESEGNPKAKSKDCVGVLQIRPILVHDANEYLKIKKNNKRFTLNDRLSVSKSKEMFILYQKRYNPTNDIEKAIRLWNGGYGYSVAKTEKSYRKVLAHMK